MPRDAPERIAACLLMTAVFYVVIQAHSRFGFGDLLCLYRVVKYFSHVEYPPNRQHAKIDFCVRSVSFF